MSTHIRIHLRGQSFDQFGYKIVSQGDALLLHKLHGYQLAGTLKDFLQFLLGFIAAQLIASLRHHILAYLTDRISVNGHYALLPHGLYAMARRPAVLCIAIKIN